MRFKYKRKTYPAIKIGDVYYVRDENFLSANIYIFYTPTKKTLKGVKKIMGSMSICV